VTTTIAPTAAAAVRLFMAQREAVLAYIRAIVGDAHLAEDVLQDLAIIVLRKHAEIPLPDGFSGWIRVAARFEALNAVRRRGATPLGTATVDALDAAWDAQREQPDVARQRALADCRASLTPRARDLLAQRYDQGLDCGTIAARTGRTLNTIYVHLSRLHRQLRLCMERRLAEDTRT
jgi:RNA polymerase sigma-70 factor, ECF subfamily